jgi:GTP-binding protein
VSDQTDKSGENSPDFEQGRWLFSQECLFMLGVVRIETLPPADCPEIAFAGRSNVGKSSLLNALTGRKTLARTSNTPGRTRELNFFALTEGLRLVDLPGYGYAKVSRSEVDNWTQLLKSYLAGRANLRRILLLIDSRHGLKPSDIEMMDLFDEAAVVYQIVLTKVDKLSGDKAQAVKAKVEKAIARKPAAHPVVVLTSAEKKTGVAQLRADISSLANWDRINYKAKD